MNNMHTSKNIQLKQVPILHQFLQRLYALDRIEIHFDMSEELLIESRCECTDKDCATVYFMMKLGFGTNGQKVFSVCL